MALDERGFIRPTYDEILQDRITQAKELFGEDIDTSERTALGKFIRLAVYDLAKAWESLELCYYARFPNTATGVNLDRLCPFAGISRNPATYAEHEITITGEPAYEVPVGFLVGTRAGVQFYLVNPITLDENGSGTGFVACVEAGEIGNVTLGSITEIINPDSFVTGIKHANIVHIGEEVESDVDLRQRFAVAIYGTGNSTAESIRGEIMRISGVTDCALVENFESSADADGRPPHSFECYVTAPESADAAIAQAIFDKKPLGIKTHGTTTVTVLSNNGDEVNINFTHTPKLEIHVKVSIKKDDRFPTDGIEQIKSAIIAYINTLGIGESVLYTALVAKIHGVSGVKEITTLVLSTDGVIFSSGNVAISKAQTASADADNITVEVMA